MSLHVIASLLDVASHVIFDVSVSKSGAADDHDEEYPKPRRSEIYFFIDEGVQAQTVASKWLVNMLFCEIPFIQVVFHSASSS